MRADQSNVMSGSTYYSLCDLSDLVLAEIFERCDLKTLATLRITNSKFAEILKNDQYWRQACITSVEQEQIELLPNREKYVRPSLFDPQNPLHYRHMNVFGMSNRGFLNTIKVYKEVNQEEPGDSTLDDRVRSYKRKKFCRFYLMMALGILVWSALTFSLVVMAFASEASSKGERKTILDYWTTSGIILAVLYVGVVTVFCFLERSGWFAFLYIGVVVFVLPGLWFDRIFTSSHWFGVIPISLLFLAFTVVICWQCCDHDIGRITAYCWLPLIYLCYLASFLLSTLKLDNVISLPWSIVMIPALFAVPFTSYVLHKTELDEDVFDVYSSTKQCCIWFWLAIVVWTQMILILLRSDKVFKFHYHFCFIPIYLAAVAVGIYFLVKSKEEYSDRSWAVRDRRNTLQTQLKQQQKERKAARLDQLLSELA